MVHSGGWIQHCPYCAGRRIGQGNSFADKCPEAAAEWDYENWCKNALSNTAFQRDLAYQATGSDVGLVS